MVKEVVAIEEKNGSTLWQDAIEREMENVTIVFQITPNGEETPNFYQHINCHMVAYIKMKDFHRKAWFMVGGHMTYTLDINTYMSVVTRETVCIILAMAVWNDLEVKAADVLMLMWWHSSKKRYGHY